MIASVSRSVQRLCGSLAWLALALVLLAGCGGGGGGGDEVGDVVREYVAAVADRDGKRACALVTRDAQLRIFRSRRVHAGEDHPDQACAAVVESFGPLYGVGRLKGVEVTDVEVDGDRAEARADGFPVRLVKDAGEWKIASVGLAQRIGDSQPRRRG